MTSVGEQSQAYLYRWVEVTLIGKGENISITDVSDFRDGKILAHLAGALLKTPPPKLNFNSQNKLNILGNLEVILDLFATEVKVWCSPIEIYDCNENMILGLLYALAKKYQTSQKQEIIEWYQKMTENYNIQNDIPPISSLSDRAFQNGLAFVALVNSIKPDSIDLKAIGKENKKDLLTAAFNVAEDLGIPAILSVDTTLDEPAVITYLSYFYNKYKGNNPFPAPIAKEYVEQLESRVKQLEDEMVKANEYVEKTTAKYKEILVTSAKELEELQETTKQLEVELESTKEQNKSVEQKIEELTLKMPFFINAALNSIPAPEGNVTLVFTDVQSSTDQWEQRPKAMAISLAIHNKLMRDMITKHHGYEVKTEGDAFMIAFGSASQALKWCIETQNALLTQEWPEEIFDGDAAAIEHVDGVLIYRGLRVRMGIHSGTPTAERDPVNGRMDYFGPMVNRAARVEGTAHGGQIVISGETYAEIQPLIQTEFANVDITPMGTHRLKGLQTDTELYQFLPQSLSKRTFPIYGQQGIDSTSAVDLVEEKPKNLESQMSGLTAENESLKARLQELEHEIEEAKQRMAELDAWLKSQSDVPEAFVRDFKGVVENVGALIKSQTEISESLSSCRLRDKDNRKIIKLTKSQLLAAVERESTLQEQMEATQVENKRLQDDISKLEEKDKISQQQLEVLEVMKAENERIAKEMEELRIELENHAKKKGKIHKLLAQSQGAFFRRKEKKKDEEHDELEMDDGVTDESLHQMKETESDSDKHEKTSILKRVSSKKKNRKTETSVKSRSATAIDKIHDIE